ncbi:XRE family transcriptional regulator [Paenibacillus sp. USDA918EY]|uniref:XRE family transcriptional regulator n=1 Tax=Paenibacillus sp. USDA918EY TaxID=2689575 RepID=UPI00135B28BC|nr:XRE family transcriptional regulator [Paenibacillus sp. USDA918EY]
MFGLGKKRTPLGRFIDQNRNISQEWLVKETGLNRDSISDLCDGGKNIRPRAKTVQKIISALRKAGYDVNASDFWA